MATEQQATIDFLNTYEKYMRNLMQASAANEASYMNGSMLHKLAGNAAYLHMVKSTGLLPRLNKMTPEQRKDMSYYMQQSERKKRYDARWSNYMEDVIGISFFDEHTTTSGKAASASLTESRIAGLTQAIEEMVGFNTDAQTALRDTGVWSLTAPSKPQYAYDTATRERVQNAVQESRKVRIARLQAQSRNVKPVEIRGVNVDERGVQRNPFPNGINQDYPEHTFLQLDEIMNRYGNERFTNDYDMPLYDIEEKYASQLLTEDQIKSAGGNADTIRAMLTEQSIVDKKQSDFLKQDRFQLNEMRQALFDADRQQRDIYEVLTNETRYKDLALAKSVVNGVNVSGIKTNDELLYQIRRMMATGVAVGEDGLSMRNNKGELVYTLHNTIGTGVGDEHRSIKDMTDHLTKTMNRMSSAGDQVYGEAIKATDRFYQYRGMLDEMYAERREMNTAFSGFIKIMDDEIEGKVHGMDLDEYQNLVNERTRFIKIAEGNEEFYRRHQAAIEKTATVEVLADGTEVTRYTQPLSPINQVRNAVVNTLVEADPQASIEATDEVLRILRSGRDASETIRASILSENEAAIAAREQQAAAIEERRVTQGEAAIYDETLKRYVYTDPVTGKRSIPSAMVLPKEIAPLTEDQIRAEIGRRFENDPANTRSLSWDTYQALEDKWGEGGRDYDKIRQQMIEADKPAAVQVITPKEDAGRYFKEWNAVNPDERMYVGGDVVARRKVGLDGKWVTLEAEHVLMSDLKTNIQIDGSLENLFAELSDREYRDSLDKKMLHARNDSIIKQNVIEVIYEQQWVNEDLRAKNERLYDWLAETEGRTKQVAEKLGIQTGTVTKQVTSKNLIEQFNLFMSPLNDMGGNKNNKFRLPQFLQDAISSHASWMMRPGNGDEIMSMAYDALERTMTAYGEGQKTIDLRDEGFLKAWQRQGKTETEIAKLTASLQGKTVKQRFEDAIFLDVVGNMHQSWFEYSKSNGNDVINSLIYEMADMIDETKSIDGSEIQWRPDAPDAEFTKMDPSNPNRISQEFGAGRDNIEVTKGATRDLSHLNSTASRIKAMARQARGTIEAFPFHSSILSMSNSEIAQVLTERDQVGVNGMSFMEHLQRMAGITVDPEDGGTYQDVLESLADEQERDRLSRDTRRASEYDQLMNDKLATMDEIEPIVSGEKSTRDKLLENEEEVRKMLTQESVQGPGDLKTRMQIQAVQGKDYLPATVKIGDQSHQVRITVGNQGDYIAEFPELGISKRIVARAEDAREAYMTSDLKPMRMYGGTVIQDIANPGPLQAEFPFVYDDVQTKGRGFRTQANPTDTLALMDEFRKGNMQIPYFDMETTGVDNSKLPKRMLQPLEVYAQKMEWNPEANDFVRQRNGDIGVRNAAGKAVEDSIHMFVRPTEDMERYMTLLSERGNLRTNLTPEMMARVQQLNLPINFGTEQIADPDGKIVARQYSIDALEYGKLKSADKERLHNTLFEFKGGRRTITSLEKDQSRLWYLRNIAKFAKNENFDMHAGGGQLPANYMDVLREDAAAGMRNLKMVGQTDSIGRQRVRFSPNQEVVESPFEMSQKLAAFIGESPIAGQNVSEADWQKVIKGVRDQEKLGKRAVNEATQQIRNKVETIQNELLDEIAGRYGLDDRWAYVRPVTETPTTTRTVITGQTEDGRLKGYDTQEPTRIRAEDGSSRLMNRTRTAYEPIAPGSMTPEQIQQGVREGTIVPMSDRIGGKSFSTPYNQTRAPYAEAFPDIQSKRRDVVRGWLNEFVNNKAEGRAILGDHPLAGREDVASLVHEFDSILGGLGQGLRDRELDYLDAVGEKMNVDFNTGSLRAGRTMIEESEQAMKELPNPRVLEQMFASRMAHPEERYHNAQAQIERAGIEMKGQLHSAKADVQAGMETTGRWMKDIFDQDFMQDYQPKPLQVGSILEHTTKLQNDLPLGIYEVTDIGEKHFGLRDTDGREFSVQSDTATDLHRRYHNNFRHLEGDDIDSATRAFAEDAARNYIDNANQSAYTFDLHDLHRSEIRDHGEIRNSPLRKLADTYAPHASGVQGPNLPITSTNPHIFETNQITDLLNEDTTAREKLGFDIAGGYYESPEGQARKRFLDNMDALKATGTLADDDAKQILRNFNEQIKEEGKRRGYTRKLDNKVAVNIPNQGYGQFGGQTRSLDISSPKAISDSLWGMAESMKELGGEALSRSGTISITEEAKKSTTLNSHVMNILRQNNMIDDYQTGTPPTVSAAAQQILERKDTLKPFEEYDLLGFKDRDKEFVDFIDETHSGILEKRMSELTPLQREKFDNYQYQIEDLKTGPTGYHPALRVDPRVDESATPTGTIRFTNYGGISQYEPHELVQIGNELKTRTDVDINTRNAVYGDLFKQATAGRENSMEGIMNNAAEPRRLAAMEALNWVKPITDADREAVGNKAANVLQQIDQLQQEYKELQSAGATPEVMDQWQADMNRAAAERNRLAQDMDFMGRTNRMWNPDVADWRFGLPGRYASERVGDMPSSVVQNIVDGVNTRYTEVSGAGPLRQALEGWVNAQMPGRNPNATILPKEQAFTRATVEHLQQQGLSENESADMLRQMIADRKERGATRRNGKEKEVMTITENAVDRKPPGELGAPRGAVGEHVDRLRGSVRETFDNFATAVKDSGAGKAGMWIAGLGLGAYALHQMFTAGDPLKVERKPMGHGGVTIAGYDGDDDNGPPPNQASSGGNTAYETVEGNGRTGYKLQAKAVDNNNLNYDEVANKLNDGLGSNLNINMRDETTSMDRKWLGEQMGTYIDRGHL